MTYRIESCDSLRKQRLFRKATNEINSPQENTREQICFRECILRRILCSIIIRL